MIGAIELVKDKAAKEPFPAAERFVFTVARKALEHGLLIRPLGDVIYFIPAFIITEKQIDDMFSRLHRSLTEVLDA
jgi:adenosylmethionine---8-amino-7-oxononanoate aminotransferase